MSFQMDDSARQIDWASYFRSRKCTFTDFNKYVTWEMRHELPTFKLILNHFDIGSKIIECGCGLALFSALLHKVGYNLTCVDIDPNMLKMAKKCAKDLNANITFEKADIFKLDKYYDCFDLAYSNGVLEHFETEKKRINALKEQAKSAKYVLAKVPTFLIRDKLFSGYMYPYTIMQLKKEFRKSDIQIIDTTYVGGEKNMLFRIFDSCTPPILSKFSRIYLGPSIVVLGKSKICR